MSETKRFPLQPGCGPVYSKVYQLLTGTGEKRLTDEQVTSEAGVNCEVGSKGYGTVCRVIKAVERTGRVWRRERGTGSIRLLEEQEKVTHTVSITGKAGRFVKRSATIIGTVDTSKLNDDDRTKAHAVTAQLGALALMSAPNVIKKLEVRQADTVADVAAVMDLILGKGTPRLAVAAAQ